MKQYLTGLILFLKLKLKLILIYLEEYNNVKIKTKYIVKLYI